MITSIKKLIIKSCGVFIDKFWKKVSLLFCFVKRNTNNNNPKNRIFTETLTENGRRRKMIKKFKNREGNRNLL